MRVSLFNKIVKLNSINNSNINKNSLNKIVKFNISNRAFKLDILNSLNRAIRLINPLKTLKSLRLKISGSKLLWLPQYVRWKYWSA